MVLVLGGVVSQEGRYAEALALSQEHVGREPSPKRWLRWRRNRRAWPCTRRNGLIRDDAIFQRRHDISATARCARTFTAAYPVEVA